RRIGQAERRSGMGTSAFTLQDQRLGPLPLINHFLTRLNLDAFLEEFVPTADRRVALSYAKALGVLLRSVIVEREPIYRQAETVESFAPEAFGLGPEEVALLTDDRIGRALDRLFDADRGSFLTRVVVHTVSHFRLDLREVHNDSTTVRLTGQYASATGRSLRGRRAPWITRGHSKDHRPDLKQLLFILTSSADGGIPVQFRAADGQASDARSHIETWEVLQQITGRGDFLYVADSKLCMAENLDYLDRHRGRFVTVLPRARREDREFREWIQTHEPAWELVWDRPHPKGAGGPRDLWSVFRYPLPSREGWPVIWVWSSRLTLRQQQSRRERMAGAVQELDAIRRRLEGKRPRVRSREDLLRKVEGILERWKVKRYLKVKIQHLQSHQYRQTHRGRPGPETRYTRRTTRRLSLEWKTEEEAIAYDRKTDGMYPLLTNDRQLSPREVLEAHKRQPTIEKRFQQLKSVHDIAPVFLKNEGRIEALFFVYFLGLLVQAIMERELRRAMRRRRIRELPLYPEERLCKAPSTEQVLKLFSLPERHILYQNNRPAAVFQPRLTPLQRQVLTLLGVPERAYRA
ncbi:MAG: IS1634 family transposase, partial [Planctomycetota bacterium]